MYALVFPGQGSQSIGMLNDSKDAVLDTFTEASDSLGYDLWKLISEGPEEQLNNTEYTQPAILCSSVALHRLWSANYPKAPAFVAGHSLGEYSALVAAGALDFVSAVKLTQLRGQLMQAAVAGQSGAMAAILGLNKERVSELCLQVQGLVVAANINAPEQIVISGERAAVESAAELCQNNGARRSVLLPVSVPSHSPLMQPAVAALGEAIEAAGLRQPDSPIIQNSTAQPHIAADEISTNLKTQLTAPVRWVETIQAMRFAKVRAVVEIGPNKVLCGLGRRIDADLPHLSINQSAAIDEVISKVEAN